MALHVKIPSANAGDIRDMGQSLGQEDPLEKGMATHSSTLAWRIPWIEEPGELQGSQRVMKSQTQLKQLSISIILKTKTSKYMFSLHNKKS